MPRDPRRRPSHLVRSLALAVGVVSAASAAAGDGWRSFRGPGGTGAVHQGLPPGEGALSFELAWKRPLGSGYSGVSVAGGLLVTAFTDGERDLVVALDSATGDELWRAALGPVYRGHDGSHDGPIATPAIAGRRVFALGAWGHLAAYDADTGEVAWRVHLTDDLECKKPYYGFGSSPLVVGETLVVQIGGEEGSVAGFDVATGALRWRATAILGFSENGGGFAPAVIRDSRWLARSYSPPTVWEGHAYGYTGRFLSALDLANGDLAWRSREPGDGFVIAIGGQLVVLTKEGSLHLGEASPRGWWESDRLELFEDLAWTPPSFAGGSLYLRSHGEIARVELVRRSRTADDGREVEQPAALAGLAARIAGGEEPAAAVDRFLAGRELPLIDDRSVTFLWRGEAEDVAIAGDMIGMRREEPMRRLPGTDLWWWTTELDLRARHSYLFYVDYEPTVDPSHERAIESTVLGPDMNWNRGEPVRMSWFAMPDWPGPAFDPAPAAVGGGTMESFELTLRPPLEEGEEPAPEVAVPIHVWLPPGYEATDERYPVVYVHHARAREVGDWPATLDRVVGEGVAPLLAVFVEGPRIPDYGGVVVERIVPEVDRRYRTRPERSARANVGMGWRGFLAAMVTFENPELFGRLGIQSPFTLEAQRAALEETIGQATAESLPLEVYLEWGRWDLVSPHEAMDMRQAGRQVWTMLAERGWEPRGGEVLDSTDFASWRNRTDRLLEALFPHTPGRGAARFESP